MRAANVEQPAWPGSASACELMVVWPPIDSAEVPDEAANTLPGKFAVNVSPAAKIPAVIIVNMYFVFMLEEKRVMFICIRQYWELL